jgi:response regulator RpfG family c-di-GMP phosphodiesterase
VNIPDVYRMGSSEPYSFDSNVDAICNYRSCSMLSVPLTNQQEEVLGVIQIINAQDAKGKIIPFSPSDESLMNHFAATVALAIERAQLTRNIITRMIRMAELRDPKETAAHANRVASYSVEFYEAWAGKRGVSKAEVDRQKDILRMAAMLHDVGKVAISDRILKKPEKLSPEEFEKMKRHTYMGARLFIEPQSELDAMAAEVALSHHERWDGKGYPGHIDPLSGMPLPGFEGPEGKSLPKKGEEIPLFGRIVAVADVYDALNCSRCYKKPWREERVLEEMSRLSGRHFDPEVIHAFFSRLDVLKSLANRYPDEAL